MEVPDAARLAILIRHALAHAHSIQLAPFGSTGQPHQALDTASPRGTIPSQMSPLYLQLDRVPVMQNLLRLAYYRCLALKEGGALSGTADGAGIQCLRVQFARPS